MSRKAKIVISSCVVLLAVTCIIIAVMIKSNENQGDSLKEKLSYSTLKIETTDPLYEIGEDYPVSLSPTHIAESEDAYYIQYGIIDPKHIYRLEKETGKFGILCSNPQCSHSDDRCTAYLGVNVLGDKLTYYNERIYYLNSIINYDKSYREVWLMSMNTEGSDRKKEYKISDMAFGSGYTVDYSMSNGYVYYSLGIGGQDLEGYDTVVSIDLYRGDLSNGEAVRLHHQDGYSLGYWNVYIDKETAVFQLKYRDDSDNYINKTVTYDVNSGAVTETDDGDYMLCISIDGVLYYKNGADIYKKSGDEYVKIYNVGEKGDGIYLYTNGKYIILNNFGQMAINGMDPKDRKLTIIDGDGNKIKEISTYEYEWDTIFTKDYLFAYTFQGEDNGEKIFICPIEGEVNEGIECK